MVSKEEKLAVVDAEQSRVEHGLFAAEVDVRVSKASPADTGRLEAAEEMLANVKARIEVCNEIRVEVEALPDDEEPVEAVDEAPASDDGDEPAIS